MKLGAYSALNPNVVNPMILEDDVDRSAEFALAINHRADRVAAIGINMHERRDTTHQIRKPIRNSQKLICNSRGDALVNQNSV